MLLDQFQLEGAWVLPLSNACFNNYRPGRILRADVPLGTVCLKNVQRYIAAISVGGRSYISTTITFGQGQATAIPVPRTLADYQATTTSFNVSLLKHPAEQRLCYENGLLEELGEVAGKLKRKIRGDSGDLNSDLIKECGDVLWYLSELANSRGLVVAPSRNVEHYEDPHTALRAAIKTALEFCVEPDQDHIGRIVTLLSEVVRMVTEVGPDTDFDSSHRRLIFIAAMNLEKLYNRFQESTLVGTGDSR